MNLKKVSADSNIPVLSGSTGNLPWNEIDILGRAMQLQSFF